MDWRFGADVDITGQLCTRCHALIGNIQCAILHFDMILIINNGLSHCFNSNVPKLLILSI